MTQHMHSLAVASLLTLLSSAQALACSCALPASPVAHIENAEIIFHGKVINAFTDRRGLEGRTTFEVLETWKGVESETITLEHYIPGPSCGVWFDLGSEHLIFAYTHDDKITTNSCTLLPVELQRQKDYDEALARLEAQGNMQEGSTKDPRPCK